MLLLFDFLGQGLILGFVPESVGVLIFGLGLIFLAVGLRWFMKRIEKNVHSRIQHITK